MQLIVRKKDTQKPYNNAVIWQCANFSEKLQILRRYQIENSIVVGQFQIQYKKLDLKFTANSEHCQLFSPKITE